MSNVKVIFNFVFRCSVTKQVHGDDDVLALVHTQKHIKYIESVNSNTCRTKKFKEEFGEDMYFNEYSASSAKMAAHCAVKVLLYPLHLIVCCSI